jgi:predicted metal-dependent hydrolase
MQYSLRENARARRINVTVRRDGTVWVTKPRRASMREVEAFIRKCEEWIQRTQSKFAKLPKTSKVESSQKQFKKYQGAARGFAARRVQYLNSFYGFRFSKITVRNQKSRWGSCSHKSTLSFNYRILFLPPELADYIIVHELCHLQEMNHSKYFWALVERTIPDHRARCKLLRKLERGLLG